MENNVSADVDSASQIKTQKLKTNGNERQQSLARLIKRRVAADARIKSLRDSIVIRTNQIQRLCAEEIDDQFRKEFLLRAKAQGVPVMPQETRRWSEDEERNEIIKTRK
jgi:hypothetical protein